MRPSAAHDPTLARAPLPCASLAVQAPTAIRAPLPFAPDYRSCSMRRSHPPFVPHEMCAPPMRAHGSRSRPIPCALLEYKFIKIVVHSTTWASRPSTTMRWMTAGCLDGDHSFLIHFHGPRVHPETRLYACLI
jgi:hypothetical protein